jgi:DNA-binding transcriptional LysR family regulator
MADLETRELEYFIAVAEELHFGRAAARLLIAQPALSKAIRRLESRLGVQLFERTGRGVTLTPAGKVLLDEGRGALSAVNAAAAGARQAGTTGAALRLVIKPGGDANLLPRILAAYAEQPDSCHVEVLFGGIGDRIGFLRDGRADVALLYTPLDDLRGLDWATLLVEDRFAVLPRGHRLAERHSVRLADLEHETLPRWRGMGGPGTGPEVADMAQLTHLIAAGRTIAILPLSATGHPHPDLVYVPVADAEPSSLVIAWTASNKSPHVRALVRAATSVAASARDGVGRERHSAAL